MNNCKNKMKLKWHNRDAEFERLVLAGDIGGTNTNLAFVGEKNGKFSIVVEAIFPSAEIDGLKEPIQELLSAARSERADLVTDKGCICAAGPVINNHCKLTNVVWDIDGNQLSKELGMDIYVINDFLGISYGIPILDVNNPEQVLTFTHTDGSRPEPSKGMKAVVGPGTGLGVGFLIPLGDSYIPSPSEGGHLTFAPFDEDSQAFRDYMANKLKKVPDVEMLVSGTGIQNLYDWWKDTKGLPKSEQWAEIENAKRTERPRLISRLSDSDPVAAEMLRLFVKMLARYASDISTLLLPFGGLYLAGGVAQKESRWLIGDNLFMKYFEMTCNENTGALLMQMPVYLIKDYSISLYGAANACLIIHAAV
ncbi:MAG: glucokinase [Fibromonadaceae bacterium]|jgi:glucokinase|nr:glucokinase [Fibromonadaceae bacterium]